MHLQDKQSQIGYANFDQYQDNAVNGIAPDKTGYLHCTQYFSYFPMEICYGYSLEAPL